MKTSGPVAFVFFVVAFIPFLELVAQQPGTVPPNLDPRIWGCRNHPYIATLEAQNTDRESRRDDVHPQKIVEYRNSAGMLRIDAYSGSGPRLAAIYFKNPTEPVFIMLNVAERTRFEMRYRFPDSAHASQTWTVSSLPSREILGLKTIGLQYLQHIPTTRSESGSSESTVAVIGDYWFSPAACMILEMHVTNPVGVSKDERVVRLEQREPDPSQFNIPSGYVLREPQPQ